MVPDERFFVIRNDYQQLQVRYDRRLGAVWYTLNPAGRPCFNLHLLAELRHFQGELIKVNRRALSQGLPLPVRYTVLTSQTPGVFNLGGDLELFANLIRKRDREGLLGYATACIDVLYPNAVGFDLPMTTISLVQGDALGGGFEAAVSSHIVVAEKQAKFGLPEIMFNLIPGMGAYSFLIRRTTPDVTERLITSGEVFSAEEMHELGLVDVLAEEGQGEHALLRHLEKHSRRSNAYNALNRVRHCVDPVTYEELIRITKIWVEAALELKGRDLKMIARLVQAQNRLCPHCRSDRRALEQGG